MIFYLKTHPPKRVDKNFLKQVKIGEMVKIGENFLNYLKKFDIL